MHTSTVFSIEVKTQHLLISPSCMSKELLFDVLSSLHACFDFFIQVKIRSNCIYLVLVFGMKYFITCT